MVKNIFETSVDLDAINMKVIVTSSDIILCMLELGFNKKKYNIKGSPKSILFWNETLSKENVHNIFSKYKPSTIKKYYNLIQKNCVIPKVIEILKNIDSFDSSLKKLK